MRDDPKYLAWCGHIQRLVDSGKITKEFADTLNYDPLPDRILSATFKKAPYEVL